MKKRRIPRKEKKALKSIRAIKHRFGIVVRYAIIGKVTKRKLYLYWFLTYTDRSMVCVPKDVLRFKNQMELDRWLKVQTSVIFPPKRKNRGS